MKRRDPANTVQVYPHIYSQPYYELEAWMEEEPLDKEDAKDCFESEGRFFCNLRKSLVGVFPTKEDAVGRMEELCEDEGDYFPYFFLREKPLCVMMPTDTYIKEWTFEHALLADESLVRNYAKRDYHFLGRPKEMIRHKVGDIVVAVEGDHAFWGVVGGLPPVYDGQEHGDWSDDQYLIWSAPEHHHHIRAHHVLCPWSVIPDFITPLLENIGER